MERTFRIKVVADEGLHMFPATSFARKIPILSKVYNVNIEVYHDGHLCEGPLDYIAMPSGTIFDVKITGKKYIKKAFDNLMKITDSLALDENL